MRIIGAVIVVLFGSTANAGVVFYPNYTTWKNSHSAERAGFVAGLIEGFGAIGFDKNGQALGHGLATCASEMNLNTALVADAITRHYETHPKDWGRAASLIFWEQFVLGACLDHINSARSRWSLDAWNAPSE